MAKLEKWNERIKDLRMRSGLSQAALGEIIGVANTTISGWESNAAQPNIQQIQRLANVFFVSIDYLLGNTDEEKAPQLQQTLVKFEGRHIRILHAASASGLSDETIVKLLEDLAKYRKSDNSD